MATKHHLGTVINLDNRYCTQIIDTDPEGDGEVWGSEFFRYKRDAYRYVKTLLKDHPEYIPASSMLAKPEVCEFGQTTTLARNGKYELEVIRYS